MKGRRMTPRRIVTTLALVMLTTFTVVAVAGCAFDHASGKFTANGKPVEPDAISAAVGSVASFVFPPLVPFIPGIVGGIYGIAAQLAASRRKKALADLVLSTGAFIASNPTAGDQLKKHYAADPTAGGQNVDTERYVTAIKAKANE